MEKVSKLLVLCRPLTLRWPTHQKVLMCNRTEIQLTKLQRTCSISSMPSPGTSSSEIRPHPVTRRPKTVDDVIAVTSGSRRRRRRQGATCRTDTVRLSAGASHSTVVVGSTYNKPLYYIVV